MTDFMEDFEHLARDVGQQLKCKGEASVDDVTNLKTFLEIYLAKEASKKPKLDRSGKVSERKQCCICTNVLRKKRQKFCSDACQIENKRRVYEGAKRGRDMCS